MKISFSLTDFIFAAVTVVLTGVIVVLVIETNENADTITALEKRIIETKEEANELYDTIEKLQDDYEDLIEHCMVKKD